MASAFLCVVHSWGDETFALRSNTGFPLETGVCAVSMVNLTRAVSAADSPFVVYNLFVPSTAWSVVYSQIWSHVETFRQSRGQWRLILIIFSSSWKPEIHLIAEGVGCLTDPFTHKVLPSAVPGRLCKPEVQVRESSLEIIWSCHHFLGDRLILQFVK